MKKLILISLVIIFAICSKSWADDRKQLNKNKIENTCLNLINYFNIQPDMFGQRAQYCKYNYKRDARWKKSTKLFPKLDEKFWKWGIRDTYVTIYKKDITCLDGKTKCPPFQLTCVAKKADDYYKRVYDKSIVYSLHLRNMSFNCDDYIHWEGGGGYLCDDAFINNESYPERFCTR